MQADQNRQTIKLPRTVVNQLLQHAQRDAGREVCGFISSQNGVPEKVYPIANIATPAEKQFEMAPRAQIDALRKIHEQDETLFAIYHSHPSSSAVPSQQDINEYSYPEALSLIISLNTDGVLEIRGYRMTPAGSDELAIELM